MKFIKKFFSSRFQGVLKALFYKAAPLLVLINSFNAVSSTSMVIFNLEPRNTNFIGRQSQLTELNKILVDNKVAVIAGLSGVGKTQIAKEYAYRFRENYDTIWWFDNDSEFEIQAESLISYLKKKLGKKYYKSSDKLQILSNLKETIQETNEKFLIVLDNYNALLPEVMSIFEMSKQGNNIVNVILTTHQWKGERVLNIEPFKREESVSLIARSFNESDPQLIDKMAQSLGDYPLAISQAISYLKSNPSLTLQDYNELFLKRRDELWSAEKRLIEGGGWNDGTLDNYKKTVKTSFSLTLDILKEDSVLALEMLKIASVLSSRDLPKSLLEKWAVEVNSVSPIEFHEALSALINYSIFTSQEKEDVNSGELYSQFDLLKELIIDGLSPSEKLKYLNDASALILSDLMESHGTLQEQYRGKEYLAEHLEKIVEIAEKDGLLSANLTEAKIALLHYTHCIKRDFDNATILIGQLDELVEKFSISTLSKIWFLSTKVNDVMFSDYNSGYHNYLKAKSFLNSLEDNNIAKKYYDVELDINLLGGMANIGKIDEANKLKQEMAIKLSSLNDEVFEATAHMEFVSVSMQGENYELALQELDKAESVLRKYPYLSSYLPLIMTDRAECLLHLREYKKALEVAEEASSGVSELFMDKENHFSLLLQLIKAEVGLKTGKLLEAKDLLLALNGKFAMLPGHEHDSLRVRIPLLLGEISLLEGQYDRAYEYFCDAENFYILIHNDNKTNLLSKILANLSITSEKLNDDFLAKKYLGLHAEKFGTSHKRTKELTTLLYNKGYI